MPPGSATNLNATEDQWVTSFVSAYSLDFSNFQDGIFSAVPGMFQCAVRYTYTYTDDPVHHKWIKTRSGLHSTPQIFNWIAKAPIGTQRRRLVG
jgi:hypothetical protein